MTLLVLAVMPVQEPMARVVAQLSRLVSVPARVAFAASRVLQSSTSWPLVALLTAAVPCADVVVAFGGGEDAGGVVVGAVERWWRCG